MGNALTSMIGLMPRSMLYRKAAVMLVILLTLGGGLYGFDVHQEQLDHFKWYYLKAYAAAARYTWQQADNLAAVLPLAAGGKYVYIRHEASPAGAVPVLVYHGVVAQPDGANVSMDRFLEQLFALKAAGYQTITLSAFRAFMAGKKRLPDKSFLLTFDDGRKDSYYPVDPLLKALDYNAVMFVITRHVSDDESPYYLSRRELTRMLASGRWEIESHGKDDHDLYPIDAQGHMGHFLSNLLWLEDEQRLETLEEFKERIRQDMAVSKRDIEAAFDVEVTGYAYPFGDYGQETVNLPEAAHAIAEVIESIYPLAFYQVWNGDIGNHPDPNGVMIKRLSVKPEWTGMDMLSILESGKL